MRCFHKRKPGFHLILMIIILTVLGTVGCSNNQTQPPPAQEQTEEITLYFDASTPEREYLAPEKRKVEKGDLPLKAMEELIKGPSEGSELKPVLPKETKVRSVKVEDNIAYVNFSKDLIDNLNVGSSGEIIVISAIANTLTEFPGIDKVQILIEGEKTETLAGHIDITEPVERNEKIIKEFDLKAHKIKRNKGGKDKDENI